MGEVIALRPHQHSGCGLRVHLHTQPSFRGLELTEYFNGLTRTLGSKRVHSRHSECGIRMRDQRAPNPRRKELFVCCLPYPLGTYSDLLQFSHVEQLPEIGLEARVSAETTSMIENLFLGRRPPDPAEHKLSLGIYLK